MESAHTVRMPLVFVNFALRTKDMNITVCRGAPGGGWGTMPFGKVKVAFAMGSAFMEEKRAYPKHGSANWYSRDVPSFATSCDQSLLADSFATSRVECIRWEMEVGSHGLPLCFLGSAFNVVPSETPESVNLPPICCLTYAVKVLPRKLVVGYRMALNCHLPAIM